MECWLMRDRLSVHRRKRIELITIKLIITEDISAVWIVRGSVKVFQKICDLGRTMANTMGSICFIRTQIDLKVGNS